MREINDSHNYFLYATAVMIKVLQEGRYTLTETQKQIKILNLNHNPMHTFAWINAGEIGEILVSSHKKHKVDHILATGQYRIYQVKNEPKLVDLTHLELHVGNGTWQGYLLPTGLPDEDKKRNRIIPTQEVVTKILE